jgi:hypothetical protein
MRFFAEFTLSEANGLRMTLRVGLPRLRAVTPAGRRHFGVQARLPLVVRNDNVKTLNRKAQIAWLSRIRFDNSFFPL